MIAANVFAHELGHVFGVPDSYPAVAELANYTDVRVCGCNDEAPNCEQSIMCGGYGACDICYDKTQACPLAPWELCPAHAGPVFTELSYADNYDLTVGIMNKNAAALAALNEQKYSVKDVEEIAKSPIGLLLSVFGLAGVVAFTLAKKKKRIILVSANEHFLDKENDAQAMPTMPGLLWHLWPKKAARKKEQGAAVELSPTFESNGSGRAA